jgi:hypothetical protein
VITPHHRDSIVQHDPKRNGSLVRLRVPYHAVGERIDEQIQGEIAENRKPDKPAEQMIIGIDGAFVKGRRPTDRASLEIITGRIRGRR